jgi:hypothetical protein
MSFTSLMDLGMVALVGHAPGMHVGADAAPVSAAPGPAAVPPPQPPPAPAPKQLDPWATEPTPIKASDLRDQLFTAAAYAMLFGVGMGALTDQKTAALGLVKTSMVLGIPVIVLSAMEK